MQLIQRYPYNTFNALNHFFGAGVPAQRRISTEHKWSPAVDISEKEDSFEILADLPGMTAEDVDVSVEKRVLVVTGSRASVAAENTESVRNERASGSFLRRFTLPEDVDVDAIAAKVEHGVLTITVPKSAESATRQITVQSIS